MEKLSYMFCDDAGLPYGISRQKVQALMRKHAARSRRIYGEKAVECRDWEKIVETEGLKRLPQHANVVYAK